MKKKLYNAIIETPMGSINKYTYDPILKLFKLTKVLPNGFQFPYDFGFIPNTLGGDGDPLDIMVIANQPSFTGCMVECRVLGAIEAKQKEKRKVVRNDRIIAVPAVEEAYGGIMNLKQLGKEIIEQIEHFFISYHQYKGVSFIPLRLAGPENAIKLIEKSAYGNI